MNQDLVFTEGSLVVVCLEFRLFNSRVKRGLRNGSKGRLESLVVCVGVSC